MSVDPVRIHTWTYDSTNNSQYLNNTSVIPMVILSLESPQDTSGGISSAVDEFVANLQTIQAAVGETGRELSDYSVLIQNFGETSNLKLLRNPDDRITVWFQGNSGDLLPIEDASGSIAYSSPFASNGIAECRAWSTLFIPALKTELDRLSLPYPSRFHMYYDENIGSEYATLNSSFDYSQGFMDFAYADARSTTELVDGISTFKQWVDTWATLTGGSLAWVSGADYYADSNKNLRMFMDILNYRIRDHALNESLFEIVKSSFPSVKVSNWEHANYGLRTSPVVVRPDTRIWYNTSIYSDFSSPSLYPLSDVLFSDDTVEVGASTLTSKEGFNAVFGLSLAFAGPDYTSDYAKTFVEYQIDKIQRISVVENATSAIAPWFDTSFQSYTVNKFRDTVFLVDFTTTLSANFAVGNTIQLMNSAGTIIYTGEILAKYKSGLSGFTRINVGNYSPTDPSDLSRVTRAKDTTIGITTAVSSRLVEPSFSYSVSDSANQEILTECISLGIKEYIWWQNSSLSDTQWSSLGILADWVEESTGVREGELDRIEVLSNGTTVRFIFDRPANGSWVLDELVFDTNRNPSISVNMVEVTFDAFNTGALGISGSQLYADLHLDESVIYSTDSVSVYLNNNWIYHPVTKLRNSAVTNVQSGVDMNLNSNSVNATNNSNQVVTPSVFNINFEFAGSTFAENQAVILTPQQAGDLSDEFDVSIQNKSGGTITVLSIEDVVGGTRPQGWFIRPVTSSLPTFPATIANNASLTFKVVTRGRINNPSNGPLEAGIFTARLRINAYLTSAGSGTAKYYYMRLVNVVKDSNLDQIILTKEQLFGDNVYIHFPMGSQTKNAINPFGLHPVIRDSGHLAYMRNHLKPTVDWVGVPCRGLLDRQFGSDLLGNNGGDVSFDGKQELEARGTNPIWYNSIDEAFDYLSNIEGFTFIPYIGTLRQDFDFINLLTGQNYAGFVARVWNNLNVFLKCDNLIGLGLDTPYNNTEVSPTNPPMVDGEARYEVYKLLKRLIETRSGKVYVEPRILNGASTTPFHPSQGWNLIANANFYERQNYEWFGGTALPNAEYENSDVIHWITDMDWVLIPYRIAHVLMLNQVIGASKRHQAAFNVIAYRENGKTSDNLLTDVNAALEAIVQP